MTLIEIVVVVAIMALLTATVAVSALTIQKGAQRKAARMDVQTLMNALDVYHVAKGRYPDERGGLQALLDARVIKTLPKDPWGAPYVYQVVSGEPVVKSLGRDGAEGGTGDDADISSAAPDAD
jgi:general secretion pathway protein G